MAPDTGTQAGAVPVPPPDNSAAKTLQDQQQQADQTETQVKQEAASSGGGTEAARGCQRVTHRSAWLTALPAQVCSGSLFAFISTVACTLGIGSELANAS